MAVPVPDTSTILWQPSPERAESAQVTQFAHKLARASGERFEDYAALHRFSVEAPQAFWPALWNELGMISEGDLSPVLVEGADMASARWFPGVRLSFAENLLRRDDDAVAIVARTPAGARSTVSFRQLRERTAALAAWLAAEGVKQGDRVAGILPNGIEAVVAMLATNGLGAVWSLCAPDLGPEGVVERFGQIAPRVLFAVSTGAPRADPLRRVRRLVERLPTVEHTIVVGAAPGELGASGVPNAARWEDATAAPAGGAASGPTFARLSFDHPSFILYTSGTTGLPKCIVHGMGGMLLQLLKEHRLHYDLRPGDRFFYHTSPGWNMWYWNVVALAAGASVALWDGSPLSPHPLALFDLADEEGVHVFGILAALPRHPARERRGAPEDPPARHREDHPLDRLAAVARALRLGVRPREARRVPLVDLRRDGDQRVLRDGQPRRPRSPGRDAGAGARHEDRRLRRRRPAGARRPGELVATAPFPSQPVGFWDDPGSRRYLATYFERFPGAWYHGDLCRFTEHGGLVIEGRSDATLKPGGHRIGTAEIYRRVEHLPEVVDALAVGQRWQGDVRVVLFVQLRPGVELTAELENRIRRELARNATPHHVPARIVAVTDIPRTSSGKKAELAVRAVIEDEPVKNAGALENPEALEQYRSIEALRT